MTRVLRDFTADELATMDLPSLLALRRQAYAAAVAVLPDEPRLRAWADRMTAMHGPRVGVHLHGRRLTVNGNLVTPAEGCDPAGGVGWLEALRIARYGEDERSWPGTWSEADVQRALDWERGRAPNGAFFLVAESDR